MKDTVERKEEEGKLEGCVGKEEGKEDRMEGLSACKNGGDRKEGSV